MVELINHLMRRAIGRPTLWERRRPGDRTDPRYRVLAVLTAVGLAFLWAVVLLTYLLPPAEVYGNLISGALTRNQAIFLTAATLAFTTDFLLARHLFCRFGCAVGLFQSLAWMANDRAMVVRFDTARAKACADCDDACDRACPMRLKPRTIKRSMFTCTQCSECISACTEVQGNRSEQSLLTWAAGAAALTTVTGRPAPSAETTGPSARAAARDEQGCPRARVGA